MQHARTRSIRLFLAIYGWRKLLLLNILNIYLHRPWRYLSHIPYTIELSVKLLEQVLISRFNNFFFWSSRIRSSATSGNLPPIFHSFVSILQHSFRIFVYSGFVVMFDLRLELLSWEFWLCINGICCWCGWRSLSVKACWLLYFGSWSHCRLNSINRFKFLRLILQAL